MTVVATCRLQERSVFGFLAETMRAHLEGKKAPTKILVATMSSSMLSFVFLCIQV